MYVCCVWERKWRILRDYIFSSNWRYRFSREHVKYFAYDDDKHNITYYYAHLSTNAPLHIYQRKTISSPICTITQCWLHKGFYLYIYAFAYLCFWLLTMRYLYDFVVEKKKLNFLFSICVPRYQRSWPHLKWEFLLQVSSKHIPPLGCETYLCQLSWFLWRLESSKIYFASSAVIVCSSSLSSYMHEDVSKQQFLRGTGVSIPYESQKATYFLVHYFSLSKRKFFVSSDHNSSTAFPRCQRSGYQLERCFL